MKVRVTQSEVGRFSLTSTDKSFSFYMGIYDSENKLIADGDNKAQIHYSGEEEDKSDFDDAIENLDSIIVKCLEYTGRVWSTADYEGNAMLFIKTYLANYAAINENYGNSTRIYLEKKISELQKALSSITPIPEIDYAVGGYFDRKIATYNKWISDKQKLIDETIEGTPTNEKAKKAKQTYESQLQRYQSVKNTLTQYT